jgi:hypothetical protein
MTKFARAALLLALPAAVLLAGCTADDGDDTGEPTPEYSIAPTTPGPPPATLPEGVEGIAEWATVALPEDRAGAPAAVRREVGPISPQAGVLVDIAQDEGLWDLLMTCQSTDGTPLTWHIESPSAATDEPLELDCTTPNGGVPTTSIVSFDGPGAQLELASTARAVFAIEVRPHSEPLD